jgi:hypothetical protein
MKTCNKYLQSVIIVLGIVENNTKEIIDILFGQVFEI